MTCVTLTIDHFNADIMWFTKGYVEYVIPNLIPRNQKITQLSLSAEISSEAPGIDNNWPSDISFYINDTLVGTWTSPGDYGDVRGMFTPEWWPQNWNQYGLLKLLVINHKGTFIDGLKISDITTSELNLDYPRTIRFRIAVEEDSAHVGGLTIFGKASVTMIRTLLYPSIMNLLTLKKTLNNNKMTAEIKTAVILLLFYLYYHFYEGSAKRL